MDIKVIVVPEEEGLELVMSNFPCILNEGFYLVPYDLIDEVQESGIKYHVRNISDL